MVASAWGARKYGGSKQAVWGAIIGGIVGILPVIPLLFKFVRLAGEARRYLAEHRPDIMYGWGSPLAATPRFGLAAENVLWEVWRFMEEGPTWAELPPPGERRRRF